MASSFVSVAEAAALLGVSSATLRNWDRQGKLTPRRHPINRYRMYARHELDTLATQMGLFEAEPPTPSRAAPDTRAVRRLIARMHSVLRDNDSQSNIVLRFDEITKLIFLKLMSDRGSVALSSKRLSDVQLIRDHYECLAAEHSAVIPKAFSSLKCSDVAVQQCIEALETVDFSKAGFDVKGLAYEEVIRNTFDKSDHQQFFTPPQVAEFMVSACEADLKGKVCDPACGTGGFLASVARRELPYETLTGMEIDERLSWVAGVNMLLHGGHGIETLLMPEAGTLGRAAEACFGRFDAIITNPPFGSDLTDPDLLGRMRLGAGRPSRRRGILFIERCWNLLRPGGALAIVIDEGVLTLPHAKDVRSFILDGFDLTAVVSLPETTFQPYATVNASILLLRKRPGAAMQTTNPSLTFFARAENVGRKPNGDDDIRYARDGQQRLNSDFPEILDALRRARTGEPIDAESSCYVADARSNLAKPEDDFRLDYQFHHPSRQDVRRKIDECAYPLVPLHALCLERTQSLIPAQDLAGTTISYTGLAQIEAGSGKAVQEPTPADSLKSQVRPYEPGDILFARMRPNLRKAVLAEFREPGYASPECAVLVVKRDSSGRPAVDPLALSVLLRSDFVYGQIVHLVAGIGRPRISQRQLRDVLIPIPPQDAQAAVAAAYLEARSKAAYLEQAALSTQLKAQKVLSGAVADVAEGFAKRPGTIALTAEHEWRALLMARRPAAEALAWLQGEFLPLVLSRMNTPDVRRRIGLYGGDRIPENERNLTDVRNRVSLVAEYELARVATRILEEKGLGGLFFSYVVANRFPDLELRDEDGKRGLRIEVKCLASVAEEKAANFDTLKKDINPNTDFVVVFLWEWERGEASPEPGTGDRLAWDRAPAFLRVFCFHAASLAHMRDWYWLNSPPRNLGDGLQGFDLRHAVTCSHGSYKEEEGNYGKLMRMWDANFEAPPGRPGFFPETPGNYLDFRRIVVEEGFMQVAQAIAMEALPARQRALLRHDGCTVGLHAGSLAFVLGSLCSEASQTALLQGGIRGMFVFSQSYSWIEYVLVDGRKTKRAAGKKPKHLKRLLRSGLDRADRDRT